MKRESTITVLGAGYVGLTSAVLFAHAGYKVYLVEPLEKRLKIIKSGKSFFYEKGINELLEPAINDKRLIPTDNYAVCIPESDIVFSCVGTPDNPDGSSNLSYVFSAAEQTATHAKPGLIYVQKSTVPVGTGEKIEQLFVEKKVDVSYVSNPEFLRESTAINDTLYFDRVVAGGTNTKAVQSVLDVYHQLESRRDDIADLAGIDRVKQTGQYIATTRNSAELVKVASNAFLALKISFANSIEKLADAADADINQVMDAVGADPRIGRAFLNAGRGYGGGCFPKDVSGLISSALSYGVDLEIMQEAQNENDSMPGYIIGKLENAINGSLEGKRIAVLGLAFKAGTSDVRKSPGIKMCNLLHNHGTIVTAYDPQANEEAREDLDKGVMLHGTIDSAIKDVDAIIIATDWPEFLHYPLDDYRSNHAIIFVDAVNRFSPTEVKTAGFTYIGVGRS